MNLESGVFFFEIYFGSFGMECVFPQGREDAQALGHIFSQHVRGCLIFCNAIGL